MGLIKALETAVKGSLADQWLEVFEPATMDDQTVFAAGVRIRKGSNEKGTDNTVTNGSVIHVYANQFMMVVDGGKVVDYTAEAGYYTVDNSSLPSFFNGEFKDTLKESLNRMRFGGETPSQQKVYFINLQEIKGIKFGTRNPVNYFDNFYNAELFLKAHGAYSIKITDPIRFYEEVVPKNANRVTIDSINEQYMDEFLEGLQTAINNMSAEGERISFVTSKGSVLSKHMSNVLDESWKQDRGFEVLNVGIASISYDDESKKLINMRNQGAMLSDPSVREGYVQGAMARGMEAAGSNAGGATAGFMGMAAGMNTGGSFMGAASMANMQQMQMNQAAAQQPVQPQAAEQPAQAQPQAAEQPAQPVEPQATAQPAPAMPDSWTCSCGTVNTGKFCGECGSPKPVNTSWTCSCGTVNTGKFCGECGKPRS